MARKKKTVAELYAELHGTEYFDDGLRWTWIDANILPLADVLAITGIPKGRLESFKRRNLFYSIEVETSPGGSGHHLLYTTRTVLKIMAVDWLVTAGAWPECLQETFGKNREFDLTLNGYLTREYSRANPPDSINMNTRMLRFFYDSGGKTHPYQNDLELNLAMIRGEWPMKEWAYLRFDVGTFIEEAMATLIRYMRDKGIAVSDK